MTPVITWRAVLTIAVCGAWFASSGPVAQCSQQTAPATLDASRRWASFHGTLAELLEEAAESYRLPMLIALAGETHPVDVPAGTLSARQILDLALGSNPDYAWDVRGSAVYFYSRPLARDPNYFLHWKIKWFRIGGSVADTQLILRAKLANIRYHVEGEGGAVDELCPPELARHTLPTVVLSDLTAAEITLRILSIDRGFYSIVVFPRAQHNSSGADLDAAFGSWRWVPFKGER